MDSRSCGEITGAAGALACGVFTKFTPQHKFTKFT
jgi:hypothetical protein